MSEWPARSGGCACGGVRYRVPGPMRAIVACHCETCRRTSGHHVAASACRTDDLEISDGGTLRWFQASDRARRGFCGRCGGQLFFEPLPAAGITSIFAGSLDDAQGLLLEMHIFAGERSAYVEIPPAHRAFDGMPDPADMPQLPDGPPTG